MSQDPLIGRVLLGQYTIEKRLGAGGFSTIYVADQPSLGRKVAIKTIHPHLATNADTVSRFHREGLAISRLRHPAIVEVFNLGQAEDGLLWIAMEFLEGESLATRLQRQGQLPAAEVLALLRPVCEVLSEAHEQGIVHRDLKPENIMLMAYRGGWLPKVLDFGMSSLQEGSSQSSTMVGGTFAYMPPEQWQGLKYTDARSDIYALGVIAYQCLSGRLPIEADAGAFLQWAQKHLNDPPLPLTEAAPAVAEVIYKALQKDPAQRYQDIMVFWQELNQAVQTSGNNPNATAQLGPPPAVVQQSAPNATMQLGAPPGMSQSAPPNATMQLGAPPGMKPQAAPPNATAQLGPPPSMKPQTIPVNATAQLGPPPGMPRPPTIPVSAPPPVRPPSIPVSAKPLAGIPAASPPSATSGIPQAPSAFPTAPGAFAQAPGADEIPRARPPIPQVNANPPSPSTIPRELPKPPALRSPPVVESKPQNKPKPSLGDAAGAPSLKNALKGRLGAQADNDEEDEEEAEEGEDEWEPTFAYGLIATDGTLQAAYYVEDGPFELAFEDEEVKISTDFAPAYAYDSYGDLYCVITAKNGKIYGGTYDDDDYLQLKHIGGEARSNAAPSLAIWNEELCVAIKGTDDLIYIGLAEDLDDIEFAVVDEESSTIASPSIVAAGDTLYCAITGSDNLVYLAYGEDLDDFSFEGVSDSFETRQAPSLAYVGEQLYFGLTGTDNKPYLAVLDDDDAIEPWEIGGGSKTKLAPALATWEDTIYYAITNTANTPCLALANAKERKPNKTLRFYEVGDGTSTRVPPGVASEPPPEYYEEEEE